jgi:hypothetical protein
MQLVEVVLEDLRAAGVGLVEDAVHDFVDLARGFVRYVLVLGDERPRKTSSSSSP